MSIVSLASVKASLRYTHSEDDEMLQRHLDASESEIARFLNRRQLPTLPQDYPPYIDAEGFIVPEIVPTAETLAPEIYSAVCMLVAAKTEAARPEDVATMRAAAEAMVMPYRVRMGV